MFKTSLVPLDGSELAERALPYAVQLAQANSGRLVLVRAAMAQPLAVDNADWERLQATAQHEAASYLQRVAERLAHQVGVDIAAPYGRAADQILLAVDQFRADGVVMATHGRTGLNHLLHGSVAEDVLASSHVAVFLVHAQPGQATVPHFAPDDARLLVPLDFSTNDSAALLAAVALLGSRGEIVLVNVVAPAEHVERNEAGHVVAYLDQQDEAHTASARDHLEHVADDLSARSIRVVLDVRVDEPASGIAAAARDRSADLIVMATHGRTGIGRAVVGSVAGAVLRSVTAPVLLVHPANPQLT